MCWLKSSLKSLIVSLLVMPLAASAAKPGARDCSHLLISEKLTLPRTKPKFQFEIDLAEANRVMKGQDSDGGKRAFRVFNQVVPAPKVVGAMLGTRTLGVEATISPKIFGGTVNVRLYYPDRWIIVSAAEQQMVSLLGEKSPGKFNVRIYDRAASTIFFRSLEIPKLIDAALIQAGSKKTRDDFKFKIISSDNPEEKIEVEYSVVGEFDDRELDLFLSYLAYAVYSRVQWPTGKL